MEGSGDGDGERLDMTSGGGDTGLYTPLLMLMALGRVLSMASLVGRFGQRSGS